jgi:hypothetical protein
MGAGKWRDEYAQMLRGAGRVVVVADDDAPGREHAAQVAPVGGDGRRECPAGRALAAR